MREPVCGHFGAGDDGGREHAPDSLSPRHGLRVVNEICDFLVVAAESIRDRVAGRRHRRIIGLVAEAPQFDEWIEAVLLGDAGCVEAAVLRGAERGELDEPRSMNRWGWDALLHPGVELHLACLRAVDEALNAAHAFAVACRSVRGVLRSSLRVEVNLPTREPHQTESVLEETPVVDAWLRIHPVGIRAEPEPSHTHLGHPARELLVAPFPDLFGERMCVEQPSHETTNV